MEAFYDNQDISPTRVDTYLPLPGYEIKIYFRGNKIYGKQNRI